MRCRFLSRYSSRTSCPRGATGKIQRRNMPAAFLGDNNKKKTGGRAKQPTLDKDSGKPLIYSKL